MTTRKNQIKYAQEKRRYEDELQEQEEEIQLEQFKLSKQKEEKERLKTIKKKKELEATYKQQLADVAARKSERDEEIAYENELKKQISNSKARKHSTRETSTTCQRAPEEFIKKNEELLMRKERQMKKISNTRKRSKRKRGNATASRRAT
ncbi:trichohyalin [Histomonas meleagridis]|nr:trichohyalin [Histomonas meleagridis]